MSYLKVAVHPEHFKLSPVVTNVGIEEFINQKTKVNRHSSSNYNDFPIYEGNDEPCGKCYKVKTLDGLEKLLYGLVNH